MSRTTKLRWTELAQAPASPGVYAWYYEPEITDFDLDTAILEIQKRTSAGDKLGAESVVTSLLNEHVLHYFRHDPYDVTLTGPLKPRHCGTVQHEQRVSTSLVQRILEQPERIRHLRDILATSAPYFASPIYVGMSENLKSRLKKHRALIEKFRAEDFWVNQSNEVDQDDEAGFARRIASRRIPPGRLFVIIRETIRSSSKRASLDERACCGT